MMMTNNYNNNNNHHLLHHSSPPPRELWEQCVDWLVHAGVLEFDVLQLSQLATLLKDGIRLCKLANKLKDGCVDYRQLYTIQGSEFSQEKNVQLFITALHDRFGFSETELFDTSDLTQFEGFKKVINTLSRLSHTQEAITKGLRPFPESISPTSFPSSSSSSVDDIYCNLQTQIESGVDDKIYTSICHYGNDHADELYDRIVVKAPKSVETSFETFKPSSKREHQIKELLETETNYLKNCLEMLINDFYRPLKLIMAVEHMEKIFRNVEDIYKVHLSFHQSLRIAVHDALGLEKKNESDPGIGEVFTKNKSDFLAYAKYCANMDEGRETLDMVEKTEPKTRNIIQDLLKKSQSDFKLQDLLSVPFQRICKYHLLLKNIVDSTEIQNMEREKLVNGLDACNDVVNYVNEAKRDDDNQKVIEQIKRSIVGMDDQSYSRFYTYGRLKLDGLVKVTDFSTEKQTEKPKSKQRYIFIFERMILICKKLKNNSFEFKVAYDLCNYSIEDTHAESPSAITKSNSTLTRIRTATGFDYITLTLINNHNDHKIQMYLNSMQQKRTWKEAIEASINRSNPPEGVAKMHELTYQTYSTLTECNVCRKLLKGIFFQGYYCRRCNKNFHFDCIGLSYCGRARSTPSRLSESSLQIPRTERFIAIKNIVSPDPEVLNFEIHDEIVIFGETDNQMLIGRRAIFPGRSGIVDPRNIRPLSLNQRDSLASVGISNLNMSSSNPNFTDSGIVGVANGQNNIFASGTTYPPNISPILSSKKLIKLIPSTANQEIRMYPWYFGIKDRNQANDLLYGCNDGTFIVRLSAKENKYVISLAYGGNCKHMKIECVDIAPPDGNKGYYLHDARFFNSVPELIEFYNENSVNEGFDKIDTTLAQTLLKTRVYKVIHDYIRENQETSKYLTLRRGETVQVLETTGDDNGWWRFQAGDRIGFFPMSYVTPIDNGENGENIVEEEQQQQQNNNIENNNNNALNGS